MHIQWNMFGYASAGCGLPSTQTGGLVQPAAGGDADGDADGSTGSSPIMQALAQALESLGLSLSAAPAAPAAAADSGSASTASAASAPATAPAAAAPSASSSSAGGSPAGAPLDPHEVHAIARDIRHVMRALFMDVQAENLLAPASTGSSGSSPQSSFGSGLAALISQVQGGSVPANLQNAFSKLVSDLENLSGATGAGGAPVSAGETPQAAATTPAATPPPAAQTSPAAPTPASAVAPSAAAASGPQSTTSTAAGGASYQGLLLQFLTNLQSDLGLGYGGSASAPAQAATSGLMVNTLA